jgi:hypothetical protein
MPLSSEKIDELRRYNAEILVLTSFANKAFLVPTSNGKRRQAPGDVRNGLVITDDGLDLTYGPRLTRSAHLLDSFAQVCVSDKEVFAVGLAIRGHHPCRYQLLVAENNGVDTSAEQYITDLLKSLSALSAMVERDSNAPPRAPSPTEEEIPDMPESIKGKFL